MAIIKLNESEFVKAMADESASAVIEFYAEWCKPCHKVMPMVEALSEEYKTVKFYKVDADEEVLLAAALKAHTLPTVIFSKCGVIKDITCGVVSSEELKNCLEKIL